MKGSVGRRKQKESRRLPRIIGVLERVSIPEWGLYDMEARIDTGAYTSSIDVRRVVLAGSGDDGIPLAEITFGGGKDERQVLAQVAGYQRVRNSSGHVTVRPIVQAVISLAGRRFRTRINLHRREGMTYRMIIGRRALAGRFLIDVAQSSRMLRPRLRPGPKKPIDRSRGENDGEA